MAMTSAAGMYVRLSFFVSLVFWTIDLPINLNTAVYVKGTLAMGRYEILRLGCGLDPTGDSGHIAQKNRCAHDANKQVSECPM